MWITLLRWGSTAIAAVALALSYLNIEKLAEKHGWDQILVKMEEGVPDLPSWLWPALFLFSSGVALALWTNKLLSKIEQSKTTSALFPKGIYVQWLRPDISAIAENWMSIQLRVFNGTGFKVLVDLQTEGVMLFDDRHKVQPISLKTAMGNNDPITHGNSALFILVLTLHPDEAKQLSNLLDNGKLASFSYNTFKIHMALQDNLWVVASL